MPSYAEIYNLASNSDLIAKVTSAIAIAAEEIRTEDIATTNHDARVRWAKRGLLNPDGEARKFMWILLAQNAGLTQAQILNAADTAIQTAVDNAIELFIDV